MHKQLNQTPMKKILFVACFGIAFSACNTETNKATSVVKAVDTVAYPYTALYTSDITVPGSSEAAHKVLQVWKMFESNQISAMKQYFADSVTYDDASGMHFHGKSEDLLAYAGKDIADLDSLRFDISVWESAHVNNKNEDWVQIWSAERRYPKKGKADTTLIQENWQVKNGKIVYFNQYKAKVPVK
jgi:hypothetical protein